MSAKLVASTNEYVRSSCWRSHAQVDLEGMVDPLESPRRKPAATASSASRGDVVQC